MNKEKQFVRLKTKLLIYLSVIHLIGIIFCFIGFNDKRILFLVSEVILVVTFIVGYYLIVSLTKPIETLNTGIELLKNKDFSIHFIETKQEELNRLIKLYNSMIVHLREERIQIEEKNYFLDKLVTSSPSGIIIFDLDHKIIQINPAGCRLLGISEMNAMGKRSDELGIPIADELAKLAQQESKIISLENLRKVRIQKSYFMNKGFVQNFVMLEELTDEYRQAEKQAYEKLIRMMSHEVNNTVGAVNSLLGSILQFQKELPPDLIPDFKTALETAMNRNQRLNMFMKSFADVIRIPKPVLREYDLLELIDGVVRLFQKTMSDHNIILKWTNRPEKFMAVFDFTQMEQVFISLVKNAIEAIESNGEIIFTVENSPNSKSITITDSGCGIPTEQQHNLFIPFYTTKENGQGIGLTMIHEIISNHRMSISCHSKTGGPTSFKLNF